MGRVSGPPWYVSILPCSVVVLALLTGCATRGLSPRSSPPVSRTEPLVLPPRSVSPSEAAPPPPSTAPPAPVITPPQATDAARRTRPDSTDDGRSRAHAPTDVERSAAPAGRGGLVALDFHHADITAVIQTVSEIVGFNFLLAPDVQGTVTVRTIGQISRSDLFDVFRAILDVNGFTAVQAGDVYKIVRREGARVRAIPTIVGSLTDRTRPGDEIITQIVPIPSASVADLVGLLQPLLSKDGQLIARPDVHLLVIVDSVSNVARLLEIVAGVDRETLGDGVHVIPIRFADAAEVATILNQRAQRLAGAASGGSPAIVNADRRSNSLIVQAHGAEREAVRRLISGLDVRLPGRRLFFYFAEHARAKQLAATLTAIYGDVQGQPAVADVERTVQPARIVADETTNGLIVMTSSRAWPEIEASIKALDHRPRQVRSEPPLGGTASAAPNVTTAIVGTQSIEYRDVGIVLTVTPRIGEQGTVVLDVKQEVNDLGAPEPPTGSPRITKREVETAVVLRDNETLVLGGLIRDRYATGHRGIPFLKDIPILGIAFSTQAQTVERSELLILITPRVVGAGAATPGPPPSSMLSPVAPPR